MTFILHMTKKQQMNKYKKEMLQVNVIERETNN